MDLLRVARPQPRFRRRSDVSVPGRVSRTEIGALSDLVGALGGEARGSTRASRSAARRARRVAAPAPCRGAPGACRSSPSATASTAGSVGAAREDAEAPEQLLLLVGQEIVAPRDRAPQRALTRVAVTVARGEVEPGGEPLEELLDREETEPRGRELQRQREPVEAIDERRQRRRRLHRRRDRASSSEEERLRVLRRHHRDVDDAFAGELQPLPARHEEHQAGRRGEERGERSRDLRQQVFGVVEQQERAPSLQLPFDGRPQVDARLLPDRERFRDLRLHRRDIAQRGEGEPPEPAREGSRSVVRRLDRSRVLPIPPGPSIVSRRVAGSASRSATSSRPLGHARRTGSSERAGSTSRRSSAEGRGDRRAGRSAPVPGGPSVDGRRGRPALDRRWPTRSSTETRTWPPCPTAAIRAARWTSTPT